MTGPVDKLLEGLPNNPRLQFTLAVGPGLGLVSFTEGAAEAYPVVPVDRWSYHEPRFDIQVGTVNQPSAHLVVMSPEEQGAKPPYLMTRGSRMWAAFCLSKSRDEIIASTDARNSSQPPRFGLPSIAPDVAVRQRLICDIESITHKILLDQYGRSLDSRERRNIAVTTGGMALAATALNVLAFVATQQIPASALILGGFSAVIVAGRNHMQASADEEQPARDEQAINFAKLFSVATRETLLASSMEQSAN